MTTTQKKTKKQTEREGAATTAPPPKPALLDASVAILAALIVAIGPFAAVVFSEVYNREDHPVATIDDPQQDDTIDGIDLLVSGRANVTDRLWLVVRSTEIVRTFPQGGPLEVQFDGSWRHRVEIGQDDTAPREQFIVAVVYAAEDSAQVALQDYASCERRGTCFDMVELPEGAWVLDDVRVVKGAASPTED